MTIIDNWSLMKCARHPTEIFTGFCSRCLTERLSSITGPERNSNRFCGLPSDDIYDTSAISDFTDLVRKSPERVVRNSLLSLFQLEDENKVDANAEENKTRNLVVKDDKRSDKGGISEIECEHEDEAFHRRDGLESVQTRVSFDQGSWISEGRPEAEMKASSSCSTTVECSSVETCAVKKADGDKNSRQGSVSFWSESIVSRKVLKLKIFSALNKSSLHDRGLCCGLQEKHSETKQKCRHSCDWNFPDNSSKASWEDPRHSWDGSVMSKAFLCTFSCLEEAGDGNSTNHFGKNGQITSLLHLRKRTSKEEGSNIEHVPDTPSFDGDINRLGLLPPSKTSRPLRDRFLEEPHNDIVPNTSRRMSCRWSRVWNWNVKSPFRDFGRKKECILERSFSESWRECNRVKIVGSESDSGNGPNSASAKSGFSRSRNFHNGGIQNARLDWQKNSNGYQFSRSRSFRYSSPGHIESGLLRFYLTPLRSSRKNSSRARTRIPHAYGTEETRRIAVIQTLKMVTKFVA